MKWTEADVDLDRIGIRKVVGYSYEEALQRVPEELKKEGFGVLTEIDVKETLKKKIDVDFRKYKILGACNPPSAHKVLSAAPEIGLLLPCNVIVYEGDDGKTVVSAFDPMQVAEFASQPGIKAVAEDIRARLGRVIDAL